MKPPPIDYIELPNDGKRTKRWQVMCRDHLLGFVKWHSPWRRYCFFPQTDTLYDCDCMMTIGRYCRDQTTLHRRDPGPMPGPDMALCCPHCKTDHISRRPPHFYICRNRQCTGPTEPYMHEVRGKEPVLKHVRIIRPEWMDRPKDSVWRCLDCTRSCNQDGLNEYYMVHSAVWLEANPNNKGMLCIGCLEARLKRRLTPADFTHAPINSVKEWHSERLRSRIEGREEVLEDIPW